MKKLVCMVLVLTFCVCLACPVLAEEFVPSIPDKDAPEIVPVPDDQGGEAIGVIRDASGEIISYVYNDCLVITSVSEARTSTEIPTAAAQLLLSVYDALSNGEMELPYEKAGFGADDMVIRDLIDATWLCADHPEMLEAEGVVLELIFDLGVSAGVDVCVMTYKNEAWNPIVKAVNNGDGTVTCTFEHLCPISFSVDTDASKPPVQTGDQFDMMLWVGLLAASSAALVVLVVSRRKNAR